MSSSLVLDMHIDMHIVMFYVGYAYWYAHHSLLCMSLIELIFFIINKLIKISVYISRR